MYENAPIFGYYAETCFGIVRKGQLSCNQDRQLRIQFRGNLKGDADTLADGLTPIF
ncbi:MAG: hypothetical protein KAR47_12850 [Planctomycetes bacterium]|nr:hypothetical protein [Planctomycetota bacterium]